MTKEIILLYFRNKTNLHEDSIVEEWLSRSSENTRQALRWIDELTDEEEKLFLKLVLAEKDVWKNTVAEINGETLNVHEKDTKHFWLAFVYRHTGRYAAVLVSFVMIAFAFYLYRIHTIVDVTTDQGQIKELLLPDGSGVILNGDSHLKYASSWKGKPREIWIEGEAFFKVKHMSDHSDFKVYMTGKKLVKALGAELNVTEREGKSEVFIKSGKVIFQLLDEQKNQVLTLKPGELLEIQEGKSIKPHVVSNPEKYYGWAERR